MSLTLCGFAFSNYYNKVKLALLEKALPFNEEYVFPSDDPAFWAASPRGKIPFVRVGERTLCESQAIVEYLEDVYPTVPLYPSDPLQRAGCRSALHIMELYVELQMRRLYPVALFGLPTLPGLKDQVASDVKMGVDALKRAVKFGPYIGSETFGLADIAAACHLPLVRATSKKIYGEDVLAHFPGLDDYLQLIFQRPHVIAVERAQREDAERFMEAVRKKYAIA